MRKITSFNFITLNGFFKDAGNSISWHQHGGDAEAGEYAAQGAQSGSVLLFGRITYQMMSSFWPTKQAMETMPEVAKGMNSSEKIVFSNTLKKADWNNTRIISGDIIAEVKKLKQQPGNPMTILGSGSIVIQFSDAGLIDEYLIMLDPLAWVRALRSSMGLSTNWNWSLPAQGTSKAGLFYYRTKENKA